MKFLNLIMKLILRSPLHAMLSKSIMVITFTGRKSGRTYSTPVSYARRGGEVLMFTNGAWWKNTRGGARVSLRIRGQELAGTAQPEAEDRAAIAAGLTDFFRTVPGDARFYKITIGADGIPDAGQVAEAAKKVVMIRIRLA